MPRSILLLLALSLTFAAALAASAPARETSRGCGSMNTRHGYANQIRAARASCRMARGVAGAFNGCRSRHHRGTACRSQRGYRCTTRGRVSGVGQFYEHTRCTKGRAVVSFLNSVNT